MRTRLAHVQGGCAGGGVGRGRGRAGGKTTVGIGVGWAPRGASLCCFGRSKLGGWARGSSGGLVCPTHTKPAVEVGLVWAGAAGAVVCFERKHNDDTDSRNRSVFNAVQAGSSPACIRSTPRSHLGAAALHITHLHSALHATRHPARARPWGGVGGGGWNRGREAKGSGGHGKIKRGANQL